MYFLFLPFKILCYCYTSPAPTTAGNDICSDRCRYWKGLHCIVLEANCKYNRRCLEFNVVELSLEVGFYLCQSCFFTRQLGYKCWDLNFSFAFERVHEKNRHSNLSNRNGTTLHIVEGLITENCLYSKRNDIIFHHLAKKLCTYLFLFSFSPRNFEIDFCSPFRVA